MPDQTSLSTLTARSAQQTRPTRGDTRDLLAPTSMKVPNKMLHHQLGIKVRQHELSMARHVDRIRPASLRLFDQIPMHASDHVRQIKLISPYLAGQSVAFVGDSDGACMLLGMLNKNRSQRPRRMLLLDFDERLLEVVRQTAKEFGFSGIMETRLYNVFDALPLDLVGQFDWFYTNPPYGSHNQGASARLFITRGCELTRLSGKGCIILPHDGERDWTREAMLQTQRFLCQHSWATSEKVNALHRYHLDDDINLTSAMMLVEHIAEPDTYRMPYAGRRVEFDEIPMFYGRNVVQPYPRYIHSAGHDFDWMGSQTGSL